MDDDRALQASLDSVLAASLELQERSRRAEELERQRTAELERAAREAEQRRLREEAVALAQAEERRHAEQSARDKAAIMADAALSDEEARALGWASSAEYERAMRPVTREQQRVDAALMRVDNAGRWCADALRDLARVVAESDVDALAMASRTLSEASRAMVGECLRDHSPVLGTAANRFGEVTVKLSALAHKVLHERAELTAAYAAVSHRVLQELADLWRDKLRLVRADGPQ